MRKILYLVLLLYINVHSLSTNAGVYVFGQIGVYSLSTIVADIKNLENQSGFNNSYGGGLGVSFLNDFRVDISGLYHNPKDFIGTNSNSSTNMYHFLLRGFYDLFSIGPGSIYVGAGGGLLLGKYDIKSDFSIPHVYEYYKDHKESRDIVSYMGVGASVGFSDYVAFDVGYNYLKNFSTSSNDLSSIFANNDIKMHNITCTLRLGF